LTLSIETQPSQGTIEVLENRILYTPSAGFFGEDGFEYAVTDQDGERSTASVVVIVDPGAE
jgi:hypothetical protein